jgi:hypothetical protein
MYRIKNQYNDDSEMKKLIANNSHKKKVRNYIRFYDEFCATNRSMGIGWFNDNQVNELITHLSKIKDDIKIDILSEFFYLVWTHYDGENRNDLFEDFFTLIEPKIKTKNSKEEYIVFRVGTINGRSWTQNPNLITRIWNTWIDKNKEHNYRKRKFLQPRVYKRIIKKSDILFHSYLNEACENEFILRKNSLKNNNNVIRCEVVSSNDEFYFSDEEDVYGVHCEIIDDTPYWIPQNDNLESLIVRI